MTELPLKSIVNRHYAWVSNETFFLSDILLVICCDSTSRISSLAIFLAFSFEKKLQSCNVSDILVSQKLFVFQTASVLLYAKVSDRMNKSKHGKIQRSPGDLFHP